MLQTPRILFSETHFQSPGSTDHRTSAVDWWRTIVPYRYIKTHTDWTVELRKGAIRPDLERQVADVAWDEIGSHFDILHSGYQDSAIGYAFIQAVKAKFGLIHNMDIDDDLLNIAPYNPVMIHYQENPESFQALQTILRHTDLITCTTAHLRDVLSQSRPTKEKRSITTIPNLIDLDDYPESPALKPPKPKLKIGYIGGISHMGDFVYHNSAFWGALTYILGKYHDRVELDILGFFKESILEEIPNYVRHDGQSDFYEYQKVLKSVASQWDIAVAPLEDSLFNQSKSNIKWMESTMAGAAFIGEDITPYKCVRNGKTGFTCSTMKQWIDAFEALITNEEKRRSIVEAAKKQVKTDYSIQAKGQVWVDYFERLYRSKKR